MDPSSQAKLSKTLPTTTDFITELVVHTIHNQMAERKKAVQTTKSLIKKASDDNKDIYLALLELRNTPINDQLGSPAQRLMGRRTRTLLLTSNKLLVPKIIKPKIVQSQLKQQQNRQKHYYDQHTKQLPELNKGDRVKIQGSDGKWRSATITKVTNTPRSYIVTTPEGNTYRRNRRHINKDRDKEDSYLSDDDYNPVDESDGNTNHHSESTNPNGSPAQSPTSAPSSEPASTPVQRSTRHIRQPLRYTNMWSLCF